MLKDVTDSSAQKGFVLVYAVDADGWHGDVFYGELRQDKRDTRTQQMLLGSAKAVTYLGKNRP